MKNNIIGRNKMSHYAINHILHPDVKKEEIDYENIEVNVDPTHFLDCSGQGKQHSEMKKEDYRDYKVKEESFDSEDYKISAKQVIMNNVCKKIDLQGCEERLATSEEGTSRTDDKNRDPGDLRERNIPSEKLYQCYEFKYTSSNYPTLEKFVSHDKSYKCCVCGYVSGTKCNIVRHVRRHTGEKPYKCSECDYSSVERSKLKLHSRRHTGEKPYKCIKCDYRSTNKSDLNVHVRRHTGEKPYKCNLCDYSSVNKSDLKVHERRHTGERPFKCTICAFSSAESSNLKIHLKRHLGEKPFKCNECDYSATTKAELENHGRWHKGVKPK